MSQLFHEILIIGSGTAGLSLALRLAEVHDVAVISKQSIADGSSYYAQGGIAAVLDDKDSIDSHVNDTLNAGAYLSHPETVRYITENASECIRWLMDQGVEFTRFNNTHELHLTREGGHSHRRVAHVADSTGKAIQKNLMARVREHPNITIYTDLIAIDLITTLKEEPDRPRCLGCYFYEKSSATIEVIRSRQTVLATGGASKVYLYTSNPDGSTGDGIAMAWRAGCRVANLEFNQFHPTCLYHPQAKSFLISEAVRGEGGRLLLPDGTPFMQNFDERADLAPRDIVARAIDHEMKCLGIDYVLLDISHQSKDFIRDHFPGIYKRCKKYGFDMSREPIPVVPAAHYTCGGVMTDLNGRTDLPGLYAIGEVAHIGLHGANRLASNSLLECLVMARSVANHIEQTITPIRARESLPEWDESRVTDSDEQVVVSHNWDELRRFMWDYVGIVRTDKRLQRAQHRIGLLMREIHDYYGNFKVTPDLIELRNLVLVADLIVRCAFQRRESRGLHFSLDYPDLDSQVRDTELNPGILSPYFLQERFRKK